MANEIESINILDGGVLMTLKDGRDALIMSEELVACAEQANAFDRATKLKAEGAFDQTRHRSRVRKAIFHDNESL